MQTIAKCPEIFGSLQQDMTKRTVYLLVGVALICISVWNLFATDTNDTNEFNAIVKISLRDVGNQLLLANRDSTSLVLPIKEITPFKYKLAFQPNLSVEPDSLVSIVERSFQKADLPKNYRVEVIQCEDREVAYSYEMLNTKENNIVPCQGRSLIENCYTIDFRFTQQPKAASNKKYVFYLLLLIGLVLLRFGILKPKSLTSSNNSNAYKSLGDFQFYPTENKLVKQAIEIKLSKKECELLSIFIERPNQIIKRDELTKKVWEDNGVIVGRSLDTYISKLRKILKEDDSIQLVNVHGVGYKLEIAN